MAYSFRQGPLTAGRTVKLIEGGVQLLKRNGTLKRELRYEHLKEIREYSGVVALDERQSRFNILHCQLVPRWGRSITILSSSYIERGPGYKSIASNQQLGFCRLVQQIKRHAAAVNPKLMVVLGHRGAFVGWRCVSVLGVGLLVLALAGIFVGRRPVSETWPILLVCLVAALIIVPLSWSKATTHRPRSVPVVDAF